LQVPQCVRALQLLFKQELQHLHTLHHLSIPFPWHRLHFNPCPPLQYIQSASTFAQIWPCGARIGHDAPVRICGHVFTAVASLVNPPMELWCPRFRPICCRWPEDCEHGHPSELLGNGDSLRSWATSTSSWWISTVTERSPIIASCPFDWWRLFKWCIDSAPPIICIYCFVRWLVQGTSSEANSVSHLEHCNCMITNLAQRQTNK